MKKTNNKKKCNEGECKSPFIENFLYVLITIAILVVVFFNPISEALSSYLTPKPSVKTPISKPIKTEKKINLYGFDFDSGVLTQEHKKKLDSLLIYLSNHPNAYIIVEGHCDERGTREYNLALGERRALAVRDYLIAIGVEGKRITTISYGKERPINNDNTEEGDRTNRRVEIRAQ